MNDMSDHELQAQRDYFNDRCRSIQREFDYALQTHLSVLVNKYRVGRFSSFGFTGSTDHPKYKELRQLVDLANNEIQKSKDLDFQLQISLGNQVEEGTRLFQRLISEFRDLFYLGGENPDMKELQLQVDDILLRTQAKMNSVCATKKSAIAKPKKVSKKTAKKRR